MALLFAKAISLKMRAVIINIFAAEIVYSLGVTFLYLGYPIRAQNGKEDDISCLISGSFFSIGLNANLFATAFFAIMVYLFVKFGQKKLKWLIIAPFLVVSWIISIFLGLLFFANIFTINFVPINGFCVAVLEEMSALNLLVQVIRPLETIVCLIIVVTFSILTYWYVRGNASDENISVKKAIMRVLFYHTIRMIVVIVQFGSRIVYSSFRSAVEMRAGLVVALSLEYIISRVSFDVTTLLTPILSIVILKPVRDALKEIYSKCSSCKKNQVAPSPAPGTTETS